MINLGNHLPATIELDKREEVVVVGTDRVLLHVDAHNRRRRRDREDVEPRPDVRRGAVLLDEVVEVPDRTAEQLTIVEALHLGVLV